MSNGKYYGIAIFYIVNIDKFNSVKTLCFVSISFRVGYYRGYSVLAKLIVYVDDFRISRVGAIFFKRKAENRNLCVFYRDIRLYKIFNGVFGYIFAHIVVYASAGENNLAVIAHFLGLVCKVIGVNAYAVSADKPGIEFEEIPLCACRLQNGFCIYAHFVEDY